MPFVDLIETKKRGGELGVEQVDDAIARYTAGEVPDYQMSALLMAIRWRGLSPAETAAMTLAMARSGDTYDFSHLDGPCVDKHSTGGVGDKVSLTLAPLAAVCGCRVPMVSGRGLGHTGGTLDKLESIPGFRTDLDRDEFAAVLEELGVVMGGQTERFDPADRKLYALRDVTGTVDEPGLITASILSKKLAEGARALVMDVKVGSGAFLPDLEQARGLADLIVAVGDEIGLQCRALLTDMDQPLGGAVGNALEVDEAVATLRGAGPDDLRQLTVELVAEMLVAGELAGSREDGRRRAAAALDDGTALERFVRLVERQGGDPGAVEETSRLPRAPQARELSPDRGGHVAALEARRVGLAALALGAGRETKEDDIDPAAGIILRAKRGDRVEPGTPWAVLHHGAAADVEAAVRLLESAISIEDEPPDPVPLVLERRP